MKNVDKEKATRDKAFKTVTVIVCSIIIATIFCWLSACTNPNNSSTNEYADSRRATIAAWEEAVGRVSDTCYERAVNAIVTESDRFPESCIPPLELGTYIGCYMPTEEYGIGGDMIFIYANRTDLQKKDTAVHEYTHLLSYCESDGDEKLDIELLTDCFSYYLSDEDFPDRCANTPGDYFHLDKQLWDEFGPNTVEAIGCANLEL